MTSPAQAIAWELWRRHRGYIIAAVALLALNVVVYALAGRSWRAAVSWFQACAVGYSLAALFMIFGFCEADAKTQTVGFPTRLFVLPLRTFALVALPLSFGVGAVLGFYFLWVGVLCWQWHYDVSFSRLLSGAVALAGSLASLQAAMWSLRRFNWLRVFVVLLLAAGWILLIGLSVQEPAVLRPSTLLLISTPMLVLSHVTGLIAVERERSGQWRGGVERFFQALLDALPWRGKPFVSSAGAQFWMEWRRRGWLDAIIFGCGVGASLVLLPLPVALYLDSTAILIGLSLLPLVALWVASLLGLGLAKPDAWLPELTLPPLIAIRPVSTGDIVFAKFRAAAAITILGWMLALPLGFVATFGVRLYGDLNPEVYGFWTNFPMNHPLLWAWLKNPVVLALFPALTWSAMVEAMRPGLTGSPRTVGWHLGLSSLWIVMVLGPMTWFYRHPAGFPVVLKIMPWITGVYVTWKWASSFRAFRKARLSGIFSGRQFAVMVLTWLGITVAIAFAAVLGCRSGQVPSAMVLFFSVWLLPGQGMPAGGLNLALNRHR